MRKRKDFFEQYSIEEPLDLVGIINCAGCPTTAAPEKILKRIRAVVDYRINALHISYCMTALCPFLKKYETVIKLMSPDLTIIRGTHRASDENEFRKGMKELLCPTISVPKDMNDLIQGRLKLS